MASHEEQSVNEDGADIAAELQDDVIKLQRQYRFLREDRKAYTSETGQILRWQNQTIADLMMEENKLLTDFRLVAQKRNQVADKQLTEKLLALAGSEDAVKSSIKDERTRMKSAEDYFKKQMREVVRLSQVIGSSLADEERYIKRQKRIRMLESKIEHSVQRFDKTLARNAQHRQNIRLVTLDRKRFADLNKKLEGVYKKGRSEKMRLIRSSQSLFASREDAEHKMSLLKEKAERDRASFNAELRDLLRIIDNEKRLREFMTTKVQGLGDVYEHVMQASREKRAVNNQKVLQGEIEYHESIFQRLMEVSGLADISEIVTRYVAIEDQNFSLLNFINDQELQRKELQDAIERLKLDLVKIGKLNRTTVDERKKILGELEEQFDKASHERKKNDVRGKRARALFGTVKKVILQLHQRILKTPVGSSGMMNTSKITEQNLVQFLGVIENKAIELLQLKLLLAIEANDEQEINMLYSVWAGNRSRLPTGLDPISEYSRAHEQPIANQNASKARLNLPE